MNRDNLVVKEEHTLIGANMIINLIKRKHRCIAPGKNICMNGANTVVTMFRTVVYCSDEFQPDRFIKYRRE